MSRRAVPVASPALDPHKLNSKRTALLEAIDRLRRKGDQLPPLVEKARRLLLARYWAKADWRRRAQILATSEWLMRLAETSGNIGTTGLF